MRRAYRATRPTPPAVHRSDAAPTRPLSRVLREDDGTLASLMSVARTARRTRRGAARRTSRRRRRGRLRDRSGTRSRPRHGRGRAIEAGDEQVLAQYPPVVAVVVTRNPGPWLEDTLARAGRSRTTTTSRCSSSTAASRDDLTPRVAAVLPRAFVRRLDEGAGFADAANEALHAVEGATFLLLCHDDVVLDAVRGAAARGGGVPLERRHRRSEAGERGEPRDPARGRACHRPLRRAATPGSSRVRSTRSSTTASATSSTSPPR